MALQDLHLARLEDELLSRLERLGLELSVKAWTIDVIS